MKILIACDKFRGSMTGQEVSRFLKQGISEERQDAYIESVDLADGGEGTMELLAKIYEAKSVELLIPNAVGEQKKKRFYLNSKSRTAILEMAEYVGLAELSDSERNPFETSSEGLGVAIKEAVENGAKKIILGIGGSATNDGGAGVLFALGFQLLDGVGKPLKPKGANINQITKIITPDLHRFKEVEMLIASDVDNLLCGPNGASYTYALQKGAGEADLESLDENLRHFGEMVQLMTKNDVFNVHGYGAAGGVALGLCAFLDAKLLSGSELVFDATKLEEKIQWADVVVTGEGKIDHQTGHGKAISPIVQSAIGNEKKLILVCGIFQDPKSEVLESQARFELVKLAEELHLDSFKNAYFLTQEIGRRIGSQLRK